MLAPQAGATKRTLPLLSKWAILLVKGKTMLARSRIMVATARNRLKDHRALLPLRNGLLHLSEREIRIVERAWRSTSRPSLKFMAVSISWLGNGPAYFILAVIVLLTLEGAAGAVISAGLCVLLGHLIYPWAKLTCSRDRPCELRHELQPRLATLDRHSFPSGHAMTLTAALVPLLAAYPGLWPAALLFWLAMAWSRVACGHHYPSDVVAGTILGAAVAAPVTWLMI